MNSASRSGPFGRSLIWASAVSCVLAASTVGLAAPSVFLDADTPATGSNLDTQPLITPMGNIYFSGEIRDKDGDPDFDAAGALGDVFDIDDNSSNASLTFDFNVQSVTFIYGGNSGVFDIEARDIGGNVVDSFFQADTDDGQPAGPITLSGANIRGIFWEDPGGFFAPIDNVTIEAIPEPVSLWLAFLGVSATVAGGRCRMRAAARYPTC